jgi:hypothetical protein
MCKNSMDIARDVRPWRNGEYLDSVREAIERKTSNAEEEARRTGKEGLEAGASAVHESLPPSGTAL